MNALRILGLDTSGKTASAAILDTDSQLLLGEHTIYTSRTHSQVILPLCKELLEECRMTMADVDCLAVAVGPGSYTGLRIGIAAVQGMAMAGNIPCVGVSTLEAIASRLYGVQNIIAVMHARTDLFYSAFFSNAISKEHGLPERVTPDEMRSAAEIAKAVETFSVPPVLVGDGAAVFAEQYAKIAPPEYPRLLLAPPELRLQSAAGVCRCAAFKTPDSPAQLTASYLQAVQVQKKKTER
jgi:tRNA threonylcarbamoyladenosine biosynthesis protein TsaB